MSDHAPTSVLDMEGDWEVAITIRRKGRKVGHCDFLTDDFDAAAHIAATLLQSREVTLTGRAARTEAARIARGEQP